MNVLIRNSARVSECLLIEQQEAPQENLFRRPEVKNLIGGRKVLSVACREPHEDDLWIIDLDLGR